MRLASNAESTLGLQHFNKSSSDEGSAVGALLAPPLLLLLHLLCPRFPRYFASLCECMCMHSRDVTEMCIVVLVMKIAWRVFSTRAEKKTAG